MMIAPLDTAIDAQRLFEGFENLMCGGCRVLIDSKSEFACVDGPEFDAHRVNFEVLVQRNSMYREAERKSMAGFQAEVEAKRDSVRQELDQLCALSGGVK